MSEETIEQVRERLHRQDEAEEKRLKDQVQEAGAANAEALREREAAARDEEQQRQKFHQERQKQQRNPKAGPLVADESGRPWIRETAEGVGFVGNKCGELR